MRFHLFRPFSILVLATFCALGFFQVGCTPSVHQAMPLDRMSSVETTTFRSIVAADEISIAVPVYTGGSGFGFFGRLVNKSVTSQRSKDAEARITPLLEQTADFDFRKEFWDELIPTIQSISWLKIGNVQTTATSYVASASNIQDSCFLELKTSYQIDPSCNMLLILTHARFFERQVNKAVYYGYYTYYSDPIGTEEHEQAIDLWADNGAAAYRYAAQTGITETMKMIEFDLSDESGPPGSLVGEPVTIRFREPVENKDIKWNGAILAREENRIIFREKGGNLWSMPWEMLAAVSERPEGRSR